MEIAFVHAQRHVDAIHEPPRGGVQLGPLWMASLLAEKNYPVHYMDESVRGGSWKRREVCIRRLRPNDHAVREIPCDQSWEELQREKMADFRSMDAQEFVEKWSAFKSDGSVERYIARIGIPEEETIEHLRKLRVDAVGIPLAPSANYVSATSLGKRIKKELPYIRVVMGGQHITADPERFVRDNPWVDFVANGDALGTIERMLVGRPANKVVCGGFLQMDSYPLMNCSLFADAGYPEQPTHNYPSGLRSVDWMASRGCYRDCAFCFAGRKEQKISQLSWEKIDRQLDHFVENGIQELVLQDDAILYRSGEFFIPLLDRFKRRELSFSDNGGVEFESFSAEVADAIIRYNADARPGRCISLYVPFNPRQWNQKMTAARSMTKRFHANLENLARVRSAGVYVFTSLIVGTPDQTRESYQEDLKTLRDLIKYGYIDSALPLSATMLPGTEWHARNGKNIVHPDDWAGYNLFSTHHRTNYMSPRTIEECVVNTVQSLSDLQTVAPWQCAYAS